MASFPQYCRLIPCMLVAYALATSNSLAEEEAIFRPEAANRYFSVTLENDIVSNEDRRYTNGVRFAVLFPEEDLPKAALQAVNQIPFFPIEGYKRFGFAFGQSMFTSDDITDPNPPLDQRPYAGWLYGTFSLSSDTGVRLDEVQLSLGMVGPASRARQTQKLVHDIIDSDDPKGWDTQLKDEPTIMLSYRRSWKQQGESRLIDGLKADFSPYIGGALGNVFTNLSAGGVVRIGYNLPQDYGVPRISPSQAGTSFFVPTDTLGGYIFAGAEGRGVVRNIFLDGNTFKDSRSVRKRPFVGDIQLGMAITYQSTRLAYTHVFRGKEFYGQNGSDAFGGFTLGFLF